MCFVGQAAEVSEDLSGCTCLPGHLYPPGSLVHLKGNRASIEGTRLGEENGDWVERGLPKKGRKLRRDVCEARAR